MGASEYVLKPFSPTELGGQIRAALRKGEVPEPPNPLLWETCPSTMLTQG